MSAVRRALCRLELELTDQLHRGEAERHRLEDELATCAIWRTMQDCQEIADDLDEIEGQIAALEADLAEVRAAIQHHDANARRRAMRAA